MSKWIKVSERLPPDGLRVLVFFDGLGMDIGWYDLEDEAHH